MDLVAVVVGQVLVRKTQVPIEVLAVAAVVEVLVFLLVLVVTEEEDGLVMKMKLQPAMMVVLDN